MFVDHLRRTIGAGQNQSMENTTPTTYTRNALAVWRLVADSDGTKGGQKQYLVRIELTDNGHFVVVKYWGKREVQGLYKLASKVEGTYSTYKVAKVYAVGAVNAKLGKYELIHHDELELLPTN